MASSGTISLDLTLRHKPSEHSPTVMVFGRSKIKSIAVIEAEALELRTIRSFIASPYYVEAHLAGTYHGGPANLYGSVHVAGSLMNQVTLRTLKGTLSPPHGTIHVGTRAAGSMQLGFVAIGE